MIVNFDLNFDINVLFIQGKYEATKRDLYRDREQ